MSRIDDARAAYEYCSSAFEHSFFSERVGLPENFSSWFAVTVLHVWMLSARCKCEGEAGKEMRQELFNHLWIDVEVQLTKAGVKHNVGGIVKQLLANYYGSTLGYDEGLSKHDAYLASALLRNILGDSGDVIAVSRLLHYTRANLSMLEELPRAEVLTGRFKWKLDDESFR